MPTTPGGIVYPSATDDPDIPADLQALAESIETEFLTGGSWVTSTTGFTAASGWTLNALRYRIVGPLVVLYFDVTKASPAITVAAGSGDITNQNIFSAIPAAITPAFDAGWSVVNVGRLAAGAVAASGVISLGAVAGDGTNVAIGDRFVGYSVYFKS